MNPWIIHRNTRVNQPIYLLDADGAPVTIDALSNYKCEVKKTKRDAAPVLTFATGGGVGLGTIQVLPATDDGYGVLRDWFILTTVDEVLPASVEAGAYVADLVVVGTRDWGFEMRVVVDDGVTDI
jgi:hypothetical protein